MASLDSVSIAILLGAILVMAGIMSSLVALRFGAPLLLVFLFIGVLAGEAGPGGIRFDDVRSTYLVGSVALALILFDGGLKTRFHSIQTVLVPSAVLATVGVLLTAVITAPVAKYTLGMSWTEAMLVGAVIASTDAAAVFLLIHGQGLRLRPRVGATLEVESGTNDPFAIFLTLVLVELLSIGKSTAGGCRAAVRPRARCSAPSSASSADGWWCSALNRVALPQGLHAPFVATAAVVIFGIAQVVHSSGFLAVYLAGIVIGNRPTRAHNSVVVFLDAATWLAQIVMFVLLGLLVSPERLVSTAPPGAGGRAGADVRRAARGGVPVPRAVSVSAAGKGLHLLGRPARRGGDLPGLDPGAGRSAEGALYFDIAFVVVLVSLLVQGWTHRLAARRLHVALPRAERELRRVELDLPGQLEQELVGYLVRQNSLFLRRRVIPSWSKPTLIIRDEQIFTPAEAEPVVAGDYVYLLAPPEKAEALDRFFTDMPPCCRSTRTCSATSWCLGDVTLGNLAEVYGVPVDAGAGRADARRLFRHQSRSRCRRSTTTLPLGEIVLVVRSIGGGRVSVVGLRLPEDEEAPPAAAEARERARKARQAWKRFVDLLSMLDRSSTDILSCRDAAAPSRSLIDDERVGNRSLPLQHLSRRATILPSCSGSTCVASRRTSPASWLT